MHVCGVFITKPEKKKKKEKDSKGYIVYSL